MAVSLNNKTYKKHKKEIKKSLCVNSTCPYCNGVMTFDRNAPSSVTIDHVKPRAQGGNHDKENLLAVCKFCNERKSDKTTILFFRLNEPKKLSLKEYYNLNSYLELSNRLVTLKEIKNLIAEDRMEEALTLLNKSKEIGKKQRLFMNLTNFIKEILTKVSSIVLQIKTILTRVELLITELERHYLPAKNKMSNLNFATYSLVA